MKYFLHLSFAITATCSVASADLVIDDFDQVVNVPGSSMNVTALNDGVAGTRTITTNGASTVLTNSGLVRFFGQSFAPISMVYDFVAPLDLTTIGTQVLRMDLFRSVVGSWSIDVTVTDSLAVVSSAPSITVPPTTPQVGIQMTDWAGGADLTDITTLSFAFNPTSSTSVLESIPDANITAAPEPASTVLLGLTGLGGVIVMRRRRKRQKTA